MPASTVLKAKKKKPGLNSVPTNGSGGNFTESAMDEFLAKRGLYRKPIAKDGSCLFRAVSEQVYNCQARHLDVRNQCIDFMQRNRQQFEEFVEGPFDHHLFKLQNPKEWAGQVEITALSQMYRKDFVVYQDINSSPTKVTDHGFKDKILLCYSNGNHYDTIYHIKYQEHAAMCQSILFEMLYNKVFSELDKKEASKKGKQKGTNPISSQKSSLDWLNGSMTEDAETIDGNGDDFGWTEVKSKARAKHERHAKPVEVEEEKEQEENKIQPNNDQKYLWERRRSADPHLYRNISLEVWEEEKHTRQQQDLALAVSIQFKAGDRCQVKLGPPNAPVEKNYSAVIKEDYTGSGSVLVYIHELKERQTVPIQSVKPPENNQGHNYNYKELSGYHQKNKEDTTNGSIPEEGSKDDSKLKKKRPQRNRRGPGKDGDEAGNVSEDSTPRGRGRQRERFNRRRFPGKNDRNVKEDEEAKFIEEQIKLVELQEKDPKAFPALPIRESPQISPTPAINTPPAPKIEEIEVTPPPPLPSPKEEKPQEQEKDDLPLAEQGTPAQFWSRLKTQNAAQGKPMNEEPANQSKNSTPATSPIAKKPENPDDTMDKVLPNKDEPKLLETATDKEKENTSDKVLDEIQTNYPHRDQQETKPFQAAIQIKTLPNDNQNNKHSSHVYEVKITKNSSPIKVVQPKKIPQPVEEKQNLLLAKAESQKSHKDNEYVLPKQEAVLSLCLTDANKELIGTTVQDDIIPPAQHHPLPSTDTPLNMSSEDIFSEPEQDFPWEKQSVNTNKSKIAEPVTMATPVTIATPERKTVTFADEPKEIPPVLYKQSRIVNGTNRANHIGEQVYKPSNNTEDSIPTSKESHNLEQENTDKDHQTFPSSIANEGVQSSSPTTQQSQPQIPYILPMLPQGVQLPSGPSIDPNGADLPQDTMTLRHFFNMGYQQYLMVASQMASQQLPMVYMYQGSMQDQMMQQQQTAQPATSLAQQQMYATMQQQQLAYQHQGLQTYQAPFHMPQTSQDTTSQIERAPERQTSQTQHQTQIQTPQQIQMPPHQQQSGHFHQHQQQQQQTSLGQQSWRGGRQPRYNNPNKYQNVYHDSTSQSQRPTYHQGSGGAQRQAHYRDSNKPNRKTQGGKPRNDQYSPHFASTSHSQTMANSPGASAQTTYFPVTGADHQNKNHEYYTGSGVMYNQVNYHQHGMQPGMPNVPHNSGTRPPYN